MIFSINNLIFTALCEAFDLRFTLLRKYNAVFGARLLETPMKEPEPKGYNPWQRRHMNTGKASQFGKVA